jgi:hypothetical protein
VLCGVFERRRAPLDTLDFRSRRYAFSHNRASVGAT